MGKAAALFFKFVIVGALSLVILLALYMVDNVISDRQHYRDETVQDISASYASDQRITGPVLVQPFTRIEQETYLNDHGVNKTRDHRVQSSVRYYPSQLNVSGTLDPSLRRHGLYRVPVYEFNGRFTGHFDVQPPNLGDHVEYGIPYLAWTIKDARGIVGTPSLELDNTELQARSAVVSHAEQQTGVAPDVPAEQTSAYFFPIHKAKQGPSTSPSI